MKPETPDRLPALVGLDWGTTALRARLVAADGSILSEAPEGPGILHVEQGDFEGAFRRIAGPLLAEHPGLPVIASGMITSRNGWVETPYLPVPAGPADLAAALVRHEVAGGIRIAFVTGLLSEADGVPDVMRGEETEIVGQLAATDTDEGAIVLPGTHAKWARIEGGRIVRFSTYMTGEAYGALRDHTILGRLAAGPVDFDEASFRRGLERSLGSGGGGALLHDLFSARTLALVGRLEAEGVSDYLSGLLIGAEVAAAAGALEAGPVTIVGRGDLARRYAIALGEAGRPASVAAPGAAALGQAAIARAAGLVGGTT